MMNTYCIELTNPTEEDMNTLTEIMSKAQDEYVEYVQKFAEENNISTACANDIIYLRSRSRWTQKLEDELIQLYKEGNPPNIMDFGHDDDT
jgi:hypothetical protein